MRSVPFEIFSGLPPMVVEDKLRQLPERNFAPGEVLFRENEANENVFLIEAGELDVWKGRPHTPEGVRVARLRAGDCFGEMSAINATPSSATIIAGSAAKVRILTLSDLPVEDGMRERVTLNLARTLVHRLSRANESIQEKHERELKAMRIVAAASAFITRMLVAITCYMFSMPVIAVLTPLLPSNSLISFFFIVVFCGVVVVYMRQWPEIRAEYFFMSLARWPRQVARGLLWAIPPLLVFLAIKFSVMHTHPGEYRFFEPMTAISRGAPMNSPLWLALAVTYTGLCFAQEFIRCSIQGTLQMIHVATSQSGPWKAILVSDVVFTSIHMHLGGWFALQAFIGGLFFGYEFWRERSYLAVAVSHSVVGVFAVFIAGVPQ